MDAFSDKTVLITGATGLIGSHIVDALMARKNIKVIALGRNEKKLAEGFAEYLSDSNFSYVAQDISEPLRLEDTEIDFIFHAASPMEGKIIANTPVDVITPNLNGTVNCLEFLRKQEAQTGVKGRLVLFSSVTVYGNISGEDRTVSESDTQITECLDAGGAAYSQSKRMSEVIVHAYRKQYGVDAVIARFSTVYGNTRFKPDTAFFEFIRKAVSGENIVLNSAGLPRRDNIYVEDAIEGVLLVAAKGIDGEAYNISSNAEQGNFAAIDEIAKVIADTANKKYGKQQSDGVQVSFKTQTGEGRRAGVILNNSKLKSLGWSLQTSLDQGIAKTIDQVTA